MSNPEFTAPDYTSQTASQYKANLDASIAANGSDVVNIGFSYSAGTFTIHDAKGSALSSSNAGFVRFQDKSNYGHYKYISVEANQNFIDDAGSSEIINNLFGQVSGVATTNDITFTLYAVANDAMTSVAFMLSRNPNANSSPAEALIGAPDDAVADTYASFFSLDSIDEATYDSNPCTPIGTIRMQMSASDDWTVQALSSADGIGKFVKESKQVLIEKVTPSSASDVVFKFDGTYDRYKVVFNEVACATDSVEGHFRVSTDGGSTFSSGASDYGRAGYNAIEASLTNFSDMTIDEMRCIVAQGNSAEETAHGEFVFSNFNDSGRKARMIGRVTHVEAASNDLTMTEATHWTNATGDYDAVQFQYSSGNIASGDIILYGIKDE